VNQLNSFLSTLRTAYNQQGQLGKILIPGVSLLLLCCLCSGMISLSRMMGTRSPTTAVPSLVALTSEDTEPTPTALFDFDFPTLTPFPTQPFATALPTRTSLPTLTSAPTLTPLPTQTIPPVTVTPLPTFTLPPPTATVPPIIPSATAPRAGSVTIIAVNKPAEYAEIQNLSATPVDLAGWRLVSEMGNQSCRLRGTLQPNDVLRVWARRGNPGLDCRFPNNIWNDDTPDPAVLYNPQGQEVSRFP
jgi:hypothetical protein